MRVPKLVLKREAFCYALGVLVFDNQATANA
jgi:hypothetical protein